MALTPSRPTDTDQQIMDQRPSPKDTSTHISSSGAGSRFDPYALPRLSYVTTTRGDPTTTSHNSFRTQEDMTLLADLEARATELSTRYNSVYYQLQQEMARTPTTQEPPDLLNLTHDDVRTGPPTMNPFDSLIGYPPSTDTSRDPRYPFTQESLSGIELYPIRALRPSSITS
jgi:hypothetical protein